MRVALRVDASAAMGLGHLTRCFSLAHALKAAGAEVRFVTRELGVGSASRIAAQRFQVIELAPSNKVAADMRRDADETLEALDGFDSDWIVVDHYELDAAWHRGVAARPTRRICVIDDLADRDLDADVLVDQNPGPDHRAKYAGRAGVDTLLLGGPRFALLAPAYATTPPYAFRDPVASVGIFMGGTDVLGMSALALEACRDVAGFEGPIQVVTTRANPGLDALRAAVEASPATELLLELPDLAEFFRRHDLQVGAGGGAAWERCRVGAPAIVVQWAENQAVVLDALAERGAAWVVPEPTTQRVGHAVATLLGDAGARCALAEHARGWIDGRGAERVALALCADSLALRRARAEDARRLHAWRNDERTRRHFRDPSAISLENHLAWWQQALGDPARLLLVAHCGARDVGSVRLDLDRNDAEISLYLDPALTGLGLGTAMLTAAQRWVAEQRPGLRLVAEVRTGNDASQGAFRAAGFSRAAPERWQWESQR